MSTESFVSSNDSQFIPKQLLSEGLREVGYADLEETYLEDRSNMTISMIESIIDEEEHGLMLVGRYGSAAKRTATMILADNQTIVGKLLSNESEHAQLLQENDAYAPKFGGKPHRMSPPGSKKQ